MATAAAVGGVGAVCLAAGAIVGAPVVAAVVGIVGVGGALYGAARAVSGAIEGMKSYNNAQTDAQAQEAMGDVGGSALEFGENVALGALSGAQTVKAFGAMRGAATAGSAAAGAADSVDGALVLPQQSSASALAQYTDPLNSVLSQLDDIAANMPDATEVQQVQSLIKNFMLNPTDKTAYRQLAMAIHPDTSTITVLDPSYWEDLFKTVNLIHSEAMSAVL